MELPPVPIRPRGSFFQFTQNERPKLLQENPSINLEDLTRMLGQKWGNLSMTERKRYDDLADQDQVRFADEMNAYNHAAAEYRRLHRPEVVQEGSQKKKRDTMDQETNTGTGTESSKRSKPAPLSKAEIDALAEYEHEKEISIQAFLEEDEHCSVPREVWEGGKHDFAIELYEKAEEANDQKHVPIFERDVFKLMWRVECLRRQMDTNITLSAPTLLKRPTDAIPSIVSNIKLIGTFPTGDYWMEDPAWIDFDDPIGYYKVVDFDITGADGSIMKLNAVVNDGDADCNTGYWGGIFMRDLSKRVATIYSYGDTCTKIVQVPSNLAFSFIPFADTDLNFIFNDEAGNRRICDFSEGLSPGFCLTQFEKIMGMVMHSFMNSERWNQIK